MRHATFLLCLTLIGSPAQAVDMLDNVESERSTIDASRTEVLRRAVTCMAAHLRYDSAKGTDTSRSTVIGDAYLTLGTTQYASGGSTIVQIDEASGTIVANHRFVMPGMFGGDYVQSRIILQADDGGFLTRHVQIQRMAQQSGLMENRGFQPIPVQRMSGHQKVRAALLDLSAQLGTCIKSLGPAN